MISEGPRNTPATILNTLATILNTLATTQNTLATILNTLATTHNTLATILNTLASTQDPEDWSNDAENTALITEIKWSLTHIHIENSYVELE